MANRNRLASHNRIHIVLIPGFGGFDALGQVEYYAGITTLFRSWRDRRRVQAVLHYFDNLPTAAVRTRATRLRDYLAKRIARGEILENDKIVLVGHSTAGLDIRQLIWDLHHRNNDGDYDGGYSVPGRTIRACLDGVVFLSVPHWGTNAADWVYSHPVLRTGVIAELRAAVAGSQVYLLDRLESQMAEGAAFVTGAELLLALRDALTEANARYGKPSPSRTAEAEEAAAELALYLRLMVSDFHAINDLTSQLHDSRNKSPAHFDDEERKEELDLWRNPRIRTLSYATVGGRPFRFRSGCPAPVWELSNPCTYPEIAKDFKLSAGTDFSYRLCYRASAGGPFRWPTLAGKVKTVLGTVPPEPIELWDNDGIVNTASMLWPTGETVLVQADHLDIVGHYKLVKVDGHNKRTENGYEAARAYQAYDTLQSVPRFTREMFENVWTGIFDFATHQQRKFRRRPVKMAVTVGSG